MSSEDINLVELWLRRDKTRWLAGALAGSFAGIVALAFGIVLALALRTDALLAVKAAALPVLGAPATEVGLQFGPLIVGFLVFEILAVVLGVFYAHMTVKNDLPILLGAGFVFGTFSWIFIQNLFIQSFRPVFAANLSSGAAFFFWLVFGLALASVSFFDRAVRGR